VFEREKTDTDTQTDIEFDFFDDAATFEEPRREEAPPKRRRRLPTGPPSGGAQGLFRLGILIVAAILLAVILVLWVNSCRAGQKRAEYQDYMEDVQARAAQSQQIGEDLTTLLTTPGIKFADLRADLDGLRQQQAQVVASARELDPPGPLREQQESLVEALQFRVSGLDGLARAFATAQATTDTQLTGRRLAEQASRLIASDVIYDDLFKEGAADVLDREDIEGVEVPDSNFLSNQDLVSATSWKQVVDRLTASPTAGGLHGNQISAVRVQPGDQTLSASEDNTVKASDRLSFQVVVRNSGDSQETQVPVTLTIQQNPPIRKRQVIDLINPGDSKTLTFGDLGQVSFSTRTVVKVNVEPVAGEQNTGNNTAEYVVIFTLG
jgi:hypothetical protein